MGIFSRATSMALNIVVAYRFFLREEYLTVFILLSLVLLLWVTYDD